MLARLRTGTVLCATGTVLALTVAAHPAAAGGDLPVSLDTYGSPGPVVGIAYPPQLYSATVPVNWWTAVGVAGGFAEAGGYSYDYSLTLQPPSGPAVTSGPVELTGQDVANVSLVAVNTNYTGTACPQLAGSYVATVAGIEGASDNRSPALATPAGLPQGRTQPRAISWPFPRFLRADSIGLRVARKSDCTPAISRATICRRP